MPYLQMSTYMYKQDCTKKKKYKEKMFLPKSKKKDDGLERDTILSRLNTCMIH